MKINEQIEFYPKGKKHGKKVTGTVVKVFSDVILIKYESVIY